ncbi:glycosyltransferase family 4 protein [Cryobacterium arcticum]|uniref:Glycosyltransferase n=1 Tax=Cryobacterium arcticum TaxID=670052 RepID=A0A1B1BN20_9MICO|nr:glycosyltransferase family 1 protein [Cryobacterium arcticum]ANP73911.1 Glycosyltransferase [Cryobacterium arcticum]
MIVVDTRWSGRNGIGRYAKEVTERLALDWQEIEQSGSPSSPLDFVTKSLKIEGDKPRAVYSPGYNGFLRSVPQTITLHDLIHLEGPGSAKYRPYYDFFLKPLIKKNGHVLTVSETSKRHLENWIDDSDVRVVNAGNGSSAAFAHAGEAFESSRPYFLYVGNLKSHKNVETVVAAIAQMGEFDFYVVTSEKNALEALSEKYGVTDRVRLFSNIDDTRLAQLYRGARATVQPSLLEGFGLPALEAALCGCPVVFFDGCESVKEICAGGGRAVSDSADVREWVEVMSDIPAGERFPAHVITAEQYSWDRVALSVSNLLVEQHLA